MALPALTAALIGLWAPRLTSRHTAHLWIVWMVPGAVALGAALVEGLMDVCGLLALLSFAGVCAAAAHAPRPLVRIAAHGLMLVLAGGLFLHAVPGFDNPAVVTGAVLGPDSPPYSKYLNFDKGMAGLLLLGIYAPGLPAHDRAKRHAGAFVVRFAVLTTAVVVLALALGYVRWDPKLPAWWAAWIWSMVFLTALPEEALFRGVAQTAMERWMGASTYAAPAAFVAGGVLFGLAHAAGGPAYVVLATAAGIGYGWIFASTRSIAAAIAAHAGLNTLHFLFFSYPALS